jgi:hypothetical protein
VHVADGNLAAFDHEAVERKLTCEAPIPRSCEWAAYGASTSRIKGTAA